MPSLLIAVPAHAATTTQAVVLDSDGDGLSDVMESRFGTDPHVRDTDGDGFDDRVEVMSAWSPTSSAAIPMTKSIHINLKKQTLEQRVNGVAIVTHKISSGKASTPTPKGKFAVINKSPKAWSKMAGLWMPYWMGFNTRGYGLHELPVWPGGKREGASHLGIPVSHGCVRLGVGAARQLYEWSPVGTPVLID